MIKSPNITKTYHCNIWSGIGASGVTIHVNAKISLPGLTELTHSIMESLHISQITAWTLVSRGCKTESTKLPSSTWRNKNGLKIKKFVIPYPRGLTKCKEDSFLWFFFKLPMSHYSKRLAYVKINMLPSQKRKRTLHKDLQMQNSSQKNTMELFEKKIEI